MPQIEDVVDDDIDNMDFDLAEFDPSLRTPVAPKIEKKITKSANYEEPPLFPNIPMQNQDLPVPGPEDSGYGKDRTPMLIDADGNLIKDASGQGLTSSETMKTYQILYPCYFDLYRSHEQGRRVPKDLAVSNPLAKSISDACIRLGLATILEPDKSHPQDFGNPGRVRVLLKENGRAVDEFIKNKRVLMKKVAVHLKNHPTTLQTVKELKLPNFDPQLQSASYKPQRVPKVAGFRMNDIVPLHSPLLMAHPQLKAVYDPEPEIAAGTPPAPVMPKKKIVKVRGPR